MRSTRTRTIIAASGVLVAATLVPAVPASAQTGYLRQHVSAADRYVAGRSGLASFSAVDTATGETAASPSSTVQIRSASVIKVAIGAAALGRARAAGRTLSWTRSAQLTRMIRYSDNDATQALWSANGGASGVLGYVRSRVPGLAMRVDAGHPGAWGYTYVSSRDLALLGAALMRGTLLATPDSERLLREMRNVTPSQRWGIAQAFPGRTVALKNGWYPDSEQRSWRVNCLGILTPPGRSKPVVLAVTTKYPLSLGQGYGENTCRQVASRLLAATSSAAASSAASSALVLTGY